MNGFLLSHYDLWRGLHILSVIAWMAGFMYLPRLFIYHMQAGQGSQTARDYFEQMERKLYRMIMNPSMVATWLFGLTLIYVDGQRLGWSFLLTAPMIGKLTGVAFLTWWHHYLGRARKALAAGTSTKSTKFWRMTNELPFVAAIIMVLCVTLGVK